MRVYYRKAQTSCCGPASLSFFPVCFCVFVHSQPWKRIFFLWLTAMPSPGPSAQELSMASYSPPWLQLPVLYTHACLKPYSLHFQNIFIVAMCLKASYVMPRAPHVGPFRLPTLKSVDSWCKLFVFKGNMHLFNPFPDDPEPAWIEFFTSSESVHCLLWGWLWKCMQYQ